MRLGEITVCADHAASEAAMLSLESVATALEQVSPDLLDRLCESVLCGFVLGDEGSDLIICEPVGFPASGASKLQRLKVAPGKRYDELVTALARSGDGYGIRVVHGWPILSSR
jgi:hypothetical protein